jgi:putative two-component system response regulator
MERRTGTVLVVDDLSSNAELLQQCLTRDGYEVETAASGEAALEAIARHQPDVILLDVMMPGIDGFELCRRLKGDPATRLIPVVLVTALNEREDKIQGINAGADDFLSKPVNAHELRARVRSLIRLKQHTDELDSVESLITSLALIIEARDPYTEGHCHRLAAYATALGVRLDLGDEELAALHRGGYLHDLGKIGLPEALLQKGGPLTPAEFEVVKRHTIIGDELCKQVRSLEQVRSIIRHHHERLDGSGYPDGLAGNAIPLLAQITAIADAYDALTTGRPYRDALPSERAFEELRAEAARGWRRADLVEEFIALGRAGSLGRLAAPTARPTSPLSLVVPAA